jgi:hypothetical protein
VALSSPPISSARWGATAVVAGPCTGAGSRPMALATSTGGPAGVPDDEPEAAFCALSVEDPDESSSVWISSAAARMPAASQAALRSDVRRRWV